MTTAILAKPKQGRIKCIVWDLDGTLWDGVLLEDPEVTVRPSVVEHIRRLDAMGVLHSIASKNDDQAAMAKLRALGLDDLFLYPQINWNSKSSSIQRIAKALNLGVDAFAFVDDQEFERAEVMFGAPGVTCVDAADMDEALIAPEFTPRFVTDESAHRRGMYQAQLARDDLEREFVGTNDDFLASLGLSFTIEPARRADLQRAEELTVRTNQLNATGRTYSYEELDELRESPDHLLLVASLTDKFGSYGKIGIALVEKASEASTSPDWHLRMMLMSCRVMSRGVGMVLLNHVMRLAHEAGAGLRADFVETGRNRMMQITYAFAGFQEVGRHGSTVELSADLANLQPPPPYVHLEILG
ncbi:MAG TPA: HAD-IIIC family phosphatase [Streptosporangiaceae bacterium]|jgi:FkbH-like protein